MKRTWFTVFMCLAMASGAMPKTTSAQTPPITSCPLAEYEPYCDYGPESRYAMPDQQVAVDGRSHQAPSRTVHGSIHDANRVQHFWDGYADYLKGLYPYDYYDDTAELRLSPSKPETRDDELATWQAPNPDFSNAEVLEFDNQPSPFYGIESSVAPLANGEYSPLYGIEEANQWADSRDEHRDDSEDVAYGYSEHNESPRTQPQGDADSHDDIALSDESLADGPAQVVDEEDYASYDDNDFPYEGDDEYWDHGYWDGVSYDAQSSAASEADNAAELAHREYQEHGYEYEYDYDNYEYWYGDDNNAPAVRTANSDGPQANASEEEPSLTYDAEFYQRYEAEIRPAYSEERQPPLEAMPEPSYSPADPYEGYEGYEYEDYEDYGYDDYGYEDLENDADDAAQDDTQLEYEDYGPEYGYEYEYGNEYGNEYGDEYDADAEYDADLQQSAQYPVENSRQWNSGIDDLYASEADAAGDTQAPGDSWFDDKAWNSALKPTALDTATPSTTETLNWGEGDFYEMHDADLPTDYESQWDGTATPSPQPSQSTEDTADLYEESWFDHNDQDYESDYEPSNDYSTGSTASADPSSTTREPDYWEEYSDYVEPNATRGAAMDHGQYWYGDEGDWQAWESDESKSQFMPADSPLPESYWPEEYQPYDLESASDAAAAQPAPYMLPYAARVTIAPLWWATGSVREHWLQSLSSASENLDQFLGESNRWMQSQMLPPLEMLPNAADDWNCDRAWDSARPEEGVWDK